MKTPILPITLSYIAGLLIAYLWQLTSITIILLILLGLVGTTWLRKEDQSLYRLALVFFALGMVLLNNGENKSQLTSYQDQIVDITGTVLERTTEKEDRTSYIINIESVNGQAIREKTMLTIYNLKDLAIGDRIGARAKLSIPRPQSNPHFFDYRLYLKGRGIHTTLSAKDYQIERIGKSDDLLLILRSIFVRQVNTTFSVHLTGVNSNFLRSVVLGKNLLDLEDQTRIRELGLSHLIAVSGLHIVLLMYLFQTLFLGLKLARLPATLLAMVIILLYGLILGMPASIFRALLMMALLEIARFSRQPYHGLTALLMTLLIILVIHPYQLFDVGLQFSFLATLAIVYVCPKIQLQFGTEKPLLDQLLAILTIQLVVLPLQLYYFNQFSPLAILANLLLIPFLSYILSLGILLLAIDPWLGFFSSLTAWLINRIMDLFFSIVRTLDQINLLVFRSASWSIWLILLYFLLAGLFLHRHILRHLTVKMGKTAFQLVMFLAVSSQLFIHFHAPIDIFFLDIQQGDSLLVQKGDTVYLLDTGGRYDGNTSTGEYILLPYLQKKGIQKLDGVLISHYDSDHVGNLACLLENIKVDQIFVRQDSQDIIKTIVSPEDLAKIIYVNEQTAIQTNHLSWQFFLPEQNYADENNNSLVAKLTAHRYGILMTGDIEDEREKSLANQPIQADFLKVPHHGSKTSSTSWLLERIQPKAAFLSAGYHNVHGFPHEDVINRYREAGISVYRTDQVGSIRLTITRFGYTIHHTIRDKTILVEWFWQNRLEMAYCLTMLLISCYSLALSKKLEANLHELY